MLEGVPSITCQGWSALDVAMANDARKWTATVRGKRGRKGGGIFRGTRSDVVAAFIWLRDLFVFLEILFWNQAKPLRSSKSTWL